MAKRRHRVTSEVSSSSSSYKKANEVASSKKREEQDPTEEASYTTNNDDDDDDDSGGYCSSVVKRRRLENCNTTCVIPANEDLGPNNIPKKIRAFATRFENTVFKILQREYKRADHNHETDENGWYKGVRLITGERYEVKVLGEFMTERFDGFPKQLVDYAEQLAVLDERVQEMPANTRKFSEWSMIVSNGCDAQSIHVDVPENNVQFGLVLTPRVPGTSVLKKEGYGPYTVEDLIVDKTLWHNAPSSLKSFLTTKRQGHFTRLLSAYGPLLRPKSHLEHNMVQAHDLLKAGRKLQCGDLICTSGGIPHAGPSFDSFRMVMFGAVSPSGDDLYNVDDQYFPHTAVLFIIQIVWDHVDAESKSYLLHKLAEVVGKYDPALVGNHMYLSNHFTTFMGNIIKAKHNARSIDATIRKFLHEREHQPEAELFQYRPPKVWYGGGPPVSSFRTMFRKVFDDFQCL